MKVKGYIFGLLSSISYGLIPLFILPLKKVDFSMDTTLFYRFFFSALMLGSYLIIARKSLKIEKKHLAIILLLGMCYGISSDALFKAYDYLSAGIASTLLFVYPLIVAIIMAVFYKERLTMASVLAIVFTIAGVILLSIKNGKFDLNLIGLFIVFISALGYAIYIVTVNKSSVRTLNRTTLTFYSFIISAAYYGTKLIVGKGSFAIPSFQTGINIAIFAFVTTVISSVALVYAIKYIGSTPTSILGAFEPVVAVAISVMMFGEHFSLNLALGVLMIIIGVTLNIISDAYKQKRIKKLNV